MMHGPIGFMQSFFFPVKNHKLHTCIYFIHTDGIISLSKCLGVGWGGGGGGGGGGGEVRG